MVGTTSKRVTKRSVNACSRCRRQKIKCSGNHPCDNCAQRRLTCVFDNRDNKVMVTQGFLDDLQEKLARLENVQTSASVATAAVHTDADFNPNNQDVAPISTRLRERNVPVSPPREGSPRPSEHGSERSRRNSISRTNPVANGPMDLINPLTNAPSQYMAAPTGTQFYLGTSSNWGFSRRVLRATHEYICRCPLPTDSLLFDGFAYDLGWDGSRTSIDLDGVVVPTIDHAIFLINAVKFHCDQMFHMFEDAVFTNGLHAFYGKPADLRTQESSLWYIHFLVILAFGKALIHKKGGGERPPGVEFFVRALQLLPDATTLSQEPVISTEILCCMAWYYQALDFRAAAHNFIGQAKSTAMNYGMHTDMPITEFGEQLVERSRKIWWTIYILDRQMTSLMGLPQSILDEGVFCQLPNYSGSTARRAALSMQIRFARIIAEISSTVYGTNGTMNEKFVVRTKGVLQKIAAVGDDLRAAFPLHADERFVGISRTAAHLHLQYYQCIVLATRPLLYCCLLKRFGSHLEADSLMVSSKVRDPLQMCVESSQQILNILESLNNQGLLETFIPSDPDSVTVATLMIVMARAVDIRLLENHPLWFDKATTILDEMIASGNRIAKYRKTELHKLDDLFNQFFIMHYSESAHQGSLQHNIGPQQVTGRVGAAIHAPVAPNLSMTQHVDDMSAYEEDSKDRALQAEPEEWTAEQVMAVASNMETDDADWLSFLTAFGTQGDGAGFAAF